MTAMPLFVALPTTYDPPNSSQHLTLAVDSIESVGPHAMRDHRGRPVTGALVRTKSGGQHLVAATRVEVVAMVRRAVDAEPQ